jgi:ribosome maturation factor RimP
MFSKNEIDKILEPTIEGLGYEYVCSELSNNILRIYVDKNNGITLDDCTTISRHVNRLLDVETNVASKYSLEVSSPGAARPLVKLQHFERFVGEKVKIKLNMSVENPQTGVKQKNIVGFIKEVTNNKDVVVSNVDFPEQVYIIAFDNIGKANIVPEWNNL